MMPLFSGVTRSLTKVMPCSIRHPPFISGQSTSLVDRQSQARCSNPCLFSPQPASITAARLLLHLSNKV